jgi:hypothetical protein
VKGRLVHVLYFVPADGQDKALDTSGVLDCSVRAWDRWFLEQTKDLRWNIDTFTAKVGGGKRRFADVTFVSSRLTSAELEGFALDDELQRLGFSDPNKRYLSYVEADRGSVCGEAAYPLVAGAEPVDGRYAHVFVGGPGCYSDQFGIPGKPLWNETVAMQELLHNDGVVPIGAPRSCLFDLGLGMGHVCTGPLAPLTGPNATDLDPERFDVMFPFLYAPLHYGVLDRGNDDYFRHGLPLLRDLEKALYLKRTD